jgi:hypothetical protein
VKDCQAALDYLSLLEPKIVGCSLLAAKVLITDLIG